MTEGTQPRMARGTRLTAGILAAALVALLAFAPFASATPDPVASGSATVTLNKGFTKYLKTFGIKIQKIAPAKLSGRKATFTVTGGEMDPTTGQGTLNLGGGLQFKAGKKKAKVKGLVINTTKKGLFANVAGKKLKLATLAGWSYARSGFGVSLTVKKLKLTKSAAKQLNKKTGYAKGKPKPFIGNKLMGSATAAEEPATVTIVPGNNVVFDANNELLKKLKDVETGVETLSPTIAKGTSFEFPISGGSIAPTATAGVVQTIGGLKMVQKLPKNKEKTEFLETEITLGNFYVDLSAHTISVEVVAKSNASEKLNLGALGRSSIADLTLTGATVTTDVTNHRVTVQNAAATLQPVSAEVLEGFVQVYQAWYEGVYVATACALSPGECKEPGEQEAIKAKGKEEAAKKVENDHIAAGNPLGTFSFTAQTQ
jgi:Htaa protein